MILDYGRIAAGGLTMLLTLVSCSGGLGDSSSVPASGGTPGSGSSTQTTNASTSISSAVGGSGTAVGGNGVKTTTAPASPAGGAATTHTTTPKPALNAPPSPVSTVNLEIPATTIQQLDQNPYHAEDVAGVFTDGAGTRYDPIEINYRGAYALQTLIKDGAKQRNWKLKFTSGTLYQNRREWNFNYEPHVRQRLTYWLMRQADVKVPSARHVVLKVNGEVHGLHLEYEDADNKDWLNDAFGNNDGDLYKAGYDIPDEPVYFATTEVLGTTDADYAMHYNKKTNNDDPTQATDFSSLRKFILDLNQTPDGEFEAFLRKSFDVDSFIGYLVVANFTSHWDSLPQRPKNYWLYLVPTTSKWEFIPWDMDATFQPWEGFLDNMGTDASIFHQFDKFLDYRGRQQEEGTARPLVTRMMKVPAFRSQYVARYRQALATYLAKDYLLSQVATLSAMAVAVAQPDERALLEETRSEIEDFIEQRTASVTAELATQP